MEALFVPLSLLAGGLLAVQAGANTQLSKATGSPFAATTIQVVIAGGLLLIVAAATGTILAFAGLPSVPWWHAIGGIATAIYVASTILLFPRLGAVVTVGLFIAGQMLASLGLDTFGVLGVPRQPPETATIVRSQELSRGAIRCDCQGRRLYASNNRSGGYSAQDELAVPGRQVPRNWRSRQSFDPSGANVHRRNVLRRPAGGSQSTIAGHLLGLCVDGSNSVKAIAQVRREAMLGGSDPSEGATADVQQLCDVPGRRVQRTS
jgi:uncharacterized membrane protein YdcZ (DUF606 family)